MPRRRFFATPTPAAALRLSSVFSLVATVASFTPSSPDTQVSNLRLHKRQPFTRLATAAGNEDPTMGSREALSTQGLGGAHHNVNISEHEHLVGQVALEEYGLEAFDTFLYARKSGPHEHVKPAPELRDSVHVLLASADSTDWYVFAVALGALVAIDILILHHLPETSRTHVILLMFWFLVAIGFCIEVWYRLGPRAGITWATGYLLEIVYSMDNLFITYLIFLTFETPRRLMAKAMFIGLLGSIGFRLAFFLGMAPILNKLTVIPYVIGAILIYCGMKQVSARDDGDEAIDVTQTTIVRWIKSAIGDRLGEFYDEEGEAVVMRDPKGKFCMTLLGVVMISLLAANFIFALDVVLTKAEKLPNAYLNFSSSALAMFAVRAIFFVAREVFCRFHLVKYGVGVVLIFVGAETLLAPIVYVNALLSSIVVVAITAISIGLSVMRDPWSKGVF